MSNEIYAYPEDRDGSGRIDVSSNMSKLSELVLEQTKISIGDKKPLILLYPRSFVPLIPLIALKYSQETDKDVLILTDPDSMLKHLKKYELLSKESGQYEFMFTLPLIINDEGTHVRIVSHRVSNKQKHKLSTYLFEVAKLKELRKIIFSDYNLINQGLSREQTTIFEDIKKNVNIQLDIGTVIFENCDGIIRDYDLRDNFFKWCDTLIKSGKNVFIHTSLVYANKLTKLPEYFQPTIIDLNYEFIRQEGLENTSTITEYDIVSRIHRTSDIEIIGDIELPGIEQIENDIFENIKQLSEYEIPIDFRRGFTLLNTLRNLITHPSVYQFIMADENENYTYGNVDRYKDIISYKLKSVNTKYKTNLVQLFSSVYTYYSILKKTNRYGEMYHYTAQCKNTFLMNYLKQLDESEIYTKIGVVCFNRQEQNLINKDLEKLKLKNLEVSPIYFIQACKTQEEYDLVIMPGALYSTPLFSQLINNFSKVHIICYAGSDRVYIERQLKKITRQQWKLDSLNNLQSLCNSGNNIAKQLIDKMTASSLSETQIEEKPPETYPELIKFDLEINDEPYISNSSKSYPINKPITLILQDNDSHQIFNLECGEYTSLLKVFDDGSYDNVLASEVVSGDLIMRFGNSEGDSIFEIMKKMYNFDETIDFEIIALWRKHFHEGLEGWRKRLYDQSDDLKKIGIIDLHEVYEKLCKEHKHRPKTYQSFLGWVKDKRIGPEDKEDVYTLGIFGSFPEIKEQFEYIYQQMSRTRKLHVIIGKQINKIVKLLLSKKEKKDLDFQEQLLYDKLKFYRILKVVKNVKKADKG